MYDYNKLSFLMERIAHKYNQFDSHKHIYNGDVELTHREIHTIASIGDHPGLNLTTLAKLQGITKSAASQMINRLRKKELVEKQVSANSEAEIYIILTKKGRMAYEEHRKFHETTNDQFLSLLREIPQATAIEMEQILIKFDEALTNWTDEN